MKRRLRRSRSGSPPTTPTAAHAARPSGVARAEKLLNDRRRLQQHAFVRESIDAVALKNRRKSRLLNLPALLVETLRQFESVTLDEPLTSACDASFKPYESHAFCLELADQRQTSDRETPVEDNAGVKGPNLPHELERG